MGSPLGPLLANFFMCSTEDTLWHEGKMPTYIKRYLDDTLTIMPHITSAVNFLQYQNKSDCLLYEMFFIPIFIQELRPTLKMQSDSIRAKVFNQVFNFYLF